VCPATTPAGSGAAAFLEWGAAPNPLASSACWPGGLALCATCFAGVCPATTPAGSGAAAL